MRNVSVVQPAAGPGYDLPVRGSGAAADDRGLVFTDDRLRGVESAVATLTGRYYRMLSATRAANLGGGPRGHSCQAMRGGSRSPAGLRRDASKCGTKGHPHATRGPKRGARSRRVTRD